MTPTPPPESPELALYRSTRRLGLRTLRRVRSHLAGAWASVYHGAGMAFEEHRPYAAGDDPRRIDWHATARLGEPFVKRYVEERRLRVVLGVDVSRSMDSQGPGRTLRAAAAEAVAALALSAAESGDDVGAVFVDGDGPDTLRPRQGARHALRIVRTALAARPRPPRAGMTDLRPLLRRLLRVKPHALVFVISDLTCDPSVTSAEVTGLLKQAGARHDLTVVSLHVPLPEPGTLLRCGDPETGRVVLADPRRLAAALTRRRREADRCLRQSGVGHVAVTTEHDVAAALAAYLRSRRPGGGPF